MAGKTPVEIRDAPDAKRFEARLDGKLAGFADYRLGDQVITFTHTEVDPAFEGRGLGGQLARRALDDVRSRGLRVQPRCAFIRSWIERHADYQDLVA